MDLHNPDRERPEKFFPGNEPWESLSAAIIRSAVDDYKVYGWRGRQEIEKFFRSSYFRNISNINQDWFIKNLREMYPIRVEMVKGYE